MQQSFIVIQTEQQRTHLLAVRGIPEAADDTIDGVVLPDLQHRALTGSIGLFDSLGDDPVECDSRTLEPALRFAAFARVWAQTQQAG